MKVRDMSQLMMVDQLLPFGARGSNTAEETVFEQLFVPDKTREARPPPFKMARTLLSILCSLPSLGRWLDTPYVASTTTAASRSNPHWLACGLTLRLLQGFSSKGRWLHLHNAPLWATEVALETFRHCRATWYTGCRPAEAM